MSDDLTGDEGGEPRRKRPIGRSISTPRSPAGPGREPEQPIPLPAPGARAGGNEVQWGTASDSGAPDFPVAVTVRLRSDGGIVAALFERKDSQPLTAQDLRRAAPGAFFRIAQMLFAARYSPAVHWWEADASTEGALTGAPPAQELEDEQFARKLAAIAAGIRSPRPRQGKTPSDDQLVDAMTVLADEEDSEGKYGAMERARRRLYMNVSTLHRWRKRFAVRFANGDLSRWREALDGVRREKR